MVAANSKTRYYFCQPKRNIFQLGKVPWTSTSCPEAGAWAAGPADELVGRALAGIHPHAGRGMAPSPRVAGTELSQEGKAFNLFPQMILASWNLLLRLWLRRVEMPRRFLGFVACRLPFTSCRVAANFG